MYMENVQSLRHYDSSSAPITSFDSTVANQYADIVNSTQPNYSQADNWPFDAPVYNASVTSGAVTASIDYYANQSNSTFVDFMISFSENAYLYYTPMLTVTGTIGNVVSVMVFFRTRLRKLSSSYYLSALCISDTGFLLVNFILWLSLFNINIYNRNGCCQLFTFLSGFCSALSVWFVVAFTIERFIAVIYPLKRQTVCTVKRAKSILIGLIFVSAIHSLPLIALSAPAYTSSEPPTIVCEINKGYEVSISKYEFVLNFIIYFLCTWHYPKTKAIHYFHSRSHLQKTIHAHTYNLVQYLTI